MPVSLSLSFFFHFGILFIFKHFTLDNEESSLTRFYCLHENDCNNNSATTDELAKISGLYMVDLCPQGHIVLLLGK